MYSMSLTAYLRGNEKPLSNGLVESESDIDELIDRLEKEADDDGEGEGGTFCEGDLYFVPSSFSDSAIESLYREMYGDHCEFNVEDARELCNFIDEIEDEALEVAACYIASAELNWSNDDIMNAGHGTRNNLRNRLSVHELKTNGDAYYAERGEEWARGMMEIPDWLDPYIDYGVIGGDLESDNVFALVEFNDTEYSYDPEAS